MLRFIKKKRLEYLFQTALMNLENNRAKQALSYGKKLLEYEPGFSGGYDICTTALQMLDRGDESFDILKKGVEMAPESYILWEKISIAYSEKEDFEQAASAIDKAIQIEPKIPSLFYNKAIMLAKKEDFKAALETLELLINEIDDTFFDAYILQARILNNFKKADIAIERMLILANANLENYGVNDIVDMKKKIYNTLVESYELKEDEESAKTWREKAASLK